MYLSQEKTTHRFEILSKIFHFYSCRWTPGFQQNVYASRVNTTALLAEEIQKMPTPPKVFGIISGVGKYLLILYAM